MYKFAVLTRYEEMFLYFSCVVYQSGNHQKESLMMKHYGYTSMCFQHHQYQNNHITTQYDHTFMALPHHT